MTSQNVRDLWFLFAALSIALGCDSGKTQPEPRPVREDQFLLQSLSIKGTTATPAEVTVDGRPDADGIADTSWQAEFTLDGGTQPSSLAKDDGYTRSHTAIVEMKTADGKTASQKLTITLHE
jgi:hypothetical protein